MYYPGYQGGVSVGGQADPPPPAPPTGQDMGHRSAQSSGGESAGPVGAQPPGVARDCEAFHRLYILHEEVGRGAFSVVYRCQHRVTGINFAVKIIDMRPLQLRENFDQSRLRREVEIMRRLNHPNIIRLEEVFETPKNMLLVLEYACGTELFDSILQRKRYTEAEARPIFEQVAQALGYLHSLNIIHRDIKPENVILLDRPSPQGYFPCAKLLDFGLSKMIGQDDGSAARTFVGTPCYLAPEVEARAYGRGEAYGTKVDCWSLGAVLYVMLVARFPEFDRSNGGLRVRMDSPSWATVSDSAKDLIQRLMQPDPQLRYSVMDALRHPWVTGVAFYPGAAGGLIPGMDRMALNGAMPPPVFNGFHGAHPYYPPRPAPPPTAGFPGHGHVGMGHAQSFGTGRAGSDSGSISTGSPGISEQGSLDGAGAGGVQSAEVFKLTPSGDQVPTHLKMDANTEVIRSSMGEEGQQQMQSFSPDGTALLPLLNIQHTIANSIELAYRACEHNLDDVEDIKRSAILCRSQLIQTIKLLRKIEQTASSVLEMFPDLELAVEDGEPRLAHEFFGTVKRWVGDLRHTVGEAQHRNQESMFKLHNIITGGEELPRLADEMCDGPPMTPVSSTSSSTSEPPAPREDLESAPCHRATLSETSSRSGGLESMPSTDMDAAGARSGGASRLSRTDKVRRREEMDGMGDQSPAPPKSSRVDVNDSQQVYMSLDGELFQAVKKLKEAKENDVKLSENQLLDLFFSVNGPHNGVTAAFGGEEDRPRSASKHEDGHSLLTDSNGTSAASGGGATNGAGATPMQEAGGEVKLSKMEQSFDGSTPAQQQGGTGAGTPYSPTRAGGGSGDRGKELSMVLNKMRDVDSILEHLAIFWAQTEVILDVLLQKSEHVERFVEFAHKPRLLTRFQQRMGEYKRFWASVQSMCGKYLQAVNQLHGASAHANAHANAHSHMHAGVPVGVGPGGGNGRLYSFLDANRR